MTHPHYSRRAVLGGIAAAAATLLPFGARAETPIPVGIIGSGKIGGTVGGLWVKAGHSVMFSSRHPEELKAMADGLGPLAKTGTVAQAIAFSPVLLLAIPYGAVPQFGQDNAAAIKGKIILDADNASPGRDGTALAEEVEKDGIGMVSQKYLPGAKVVRAFNTLNFMILAREANRPAPRLAIPLAGDDPDAVKMAAQLVSDAGFDPVVVGKLVDARRIQRPNPGYGLAVSAAEFKQKLNLP